ncbi:phage virion morphogenesis protein [uncultured Microscilla sp.]|uniref:phage virion morphogenesis protein n=1 Tax=uncultured Microscilla sp. TaxID=432653 RepID=UPI0026122A28|nr:phage virion morphogenesis protein [uncultured Microscilla sp.]
MINERKFRKVMRGVPRGVGQVMLRYVQRNFASESYRGSAWPPRQNQSNNRKPLLTDTGKLKASFKVREANWRVIRVGSNRQAENSNAHLAQLHNEGAQGAATVRTYTRRGRRNGGSVRVRSHRRQTNLPQRQFMPIPGKEPLPPELWAEIERFVSKELDKVFR